jgi:hypothetical protein
MDSPAARRMLTSADGSREGAGVLFGEGGRVILVGADVSADSGAAETGVSLAERVGAELAVSSVPTPIFGDSDWPGVCTGVSVSMEPGSVPPTSPADSVSAVSGEPCGDPFEDDSLGIVGGRVRPATIVGPSGADVIPCLVGIRVGSDVAASGIRVGLPGGGTGAPEGARVGSSDVGADVVGANVGADVVGADVVGADVVGANVGADVVGADVVGAKVGADVGADVVGAKVGADVGSSVGLAVVGPGVEITGGSPALGGAVGSAVVGSALGAWVGGTDTPESSIPNTGVFVGLEVGIGVPANEG